MKKSDRQLGMSRDITRRDFVYGVGVAAMGVGVACGSPESPKEPLPERHYPPTLTGLRGSHDGSFDVAHALARRGEAFDRGTDLDESYDLVVVGGGISGLAAAHYFRKLNGPGSRILILDNHDDFGGHAKRNEFHQGGQMRLAWGGVFNLEYPMFSDTVNELFDELGVNIERLLENSDFHYGDDGALGPATYFDAETYGKDVLLPRFGFRGGDYATIVSQLDQVPLSAQARQSLKHFYTTETDVLAGMSAQERDQALRQMSYIDFLRQHGGLTEEAADLFLQTTHGYSGVGADSLSVAECVDAGLPIGHLLGEGIPEPVSGKVGGEVAMFPDGNASIARLLVRTLIPSVAPGQDADDVVTAQFDYSRLDRPEWKVRIRLNSTVVNVDERDGSVAVRYVRDGQTSVVKARHSVIACWHSIIPHLCPQLPEAQKKAMRSQVKRPLLLTNVLLRSSTAADKLGISGAYCPGRLHGATWLVKGISGGDYSHEWTDPDSVVMQFWGSLAPRRQGLEPRQQHRLARQRLSAMSFEDFEREVRTVLDGMLGPAGFNAAEDILAVVVNRWPHGYSYDYLDLWDPAYAPGQAPHEIARGRFGNLAFANADAGANAYTHVAIDEAWRAVNDLVG